jgi:hypothetical protein
MGIQFQVCKIPDMKCSFFNLTHRKICVMLAKYFIYKYEYGYTELLPKYVRAYNNTARSATGMETSRITLFYSREMEANGRQGT